MDFRYVFVVMSGAESRIPFGLGRWICISNETSKGGKSHETDDDLFRLGRPCLGVGFYSSGPGTGLCPYDV